MATDFRITSNVKEVIRVLGGMDQLLQRTVSESIQQTAAFARKQGITNVVKKNYGNKAKLTPSYINGSKGDGEDRVPIKMHVGQQVPIAKQWAEVTFTTRGFLPFLFKTEKIEYNTAFGKRHGVTVTMFGQRVATGGFHLRRAEGGWIKPGLRDKIKDKNDMIFKRGEDGKLQPFKFGGMASILRLENGDKVVWRLAEDQMDRFVYRNFDRHAFNMVREMKNALT